jgi:hypothetical protein
MKDAPTLTAGDEPSTEVEPSEEGRRSRFPSAFTVLCAVRPGHW